MNDILKDIEKFKLKILDSKEYKDYKMYLDLVEKNDDVKKLINKIVKRQKELVKKISSSKNTLKEKEELDTLYNELNKISDYKNYINASKKLNIKITRIQKRFNDFFDSLVS